jgi:hypothetical protein
VKNQGGFLKEVAFELNLQSRGLAYTKTEEREREGLASCSFSGEFPFILLRNRI